MKQTSMLISESTWQIINSHRLLGENMEQCALRLMGLKNQEVKPDGVAPAVSN
jgi:hypothetical protein